MKVRYTISEMWEAKDIHEIIEAIKFSIKFYELENPKATLTVKLISGKQEKVEATADRIKNNRYEVRLARANIENTLDAVLVALFHEMTHVKQFVHNGFALYSGKAKWESNDITLSTSNDYWFSPWEMEARAMERALVYYYDLETKDV
jgi:hypothetical protein